MTTHLFPKITGKNMIKVIVIGFLLLGTIAPMSNYEIRALFVSLDVIGHTPNVLEVLTLSQLNNVVMKGFFKDNDFDQNGKPITKNSKNTGKLFDTNLAYCLTGSVKWPVEIGFYVISKVFNGYSLNMPDVVSSINLKVYDYCLTLPMNFYVLNLLSILTLPRSSLDVDSMLVNNVINKDVIYKYLTIINPILI
ncbi:MAG: hypothetical protein LHV68_00625 [Elusimicrobia bacterium]|nr:hypothetical protein [Candidatus Liberimonas magnetica]